MTGSDLDLLKINKHKQNNSTPYKLATTLDKIKKSNIKMCSNIEQSKIYAKTEIDLVYCTASSINAVWELRTHCNNDYSLTPNFNITEESNKNN